MNVFELELDSKYSDKATIDPQQRQPIHYFFLSFPLHLVNEIVRRTNDAIGTSEASKMTAASVFQSFGIPYLMTLQR